MTSYFCLCSFARSSLLTLVDLWNDLVVVHQANKWEVAVDAVQVLNFSKLKTSRGRGWNPSLFQMVTLTLILKATRPALKLVAVTAGKQDPMKTVEVVFVGVVWAVDVVVGQQTRVVPLSLSRVWLLRRLSTRLLLLLLLLQMCDVHEASEKYGVDNNSRNSWQVFLFFS